MSRPLEDYALLGDTHTAALVSTDCSIDWLCLPRFDSGAAFAALLGGPEHGRWSLAPRERFRTESRAYRGDSLVLETTLTCDSGSVCVIDCMPIRTDRPDVVRRVEGIRGRVPMRSVLAPRFDYGSIVPWARTRGGRLDLIAGPDHLLVDADVEFDLSDPEHPTADFSVAAGDAVDFQLHWLEPWNAAAEPLDVKNTIAHTTDWWRDWAGRCSYDGPYRDAVVRSLVVLKALTYAPSGGIVAAPTTSLPEHLGGIRNWDYRYCWIRDATFTLLALLEAGYDQEARDWREWLLRAVAGRPEQMQIMYGVDGRRRLTEFELDWLPGYEDSTPVRVGNLAAQQVQLDVYGELMDALHQARDRGIPPDPNAWHVQRALMDFLEGHWRDPDHGIWEVRGPQRHFTHSKVMAWVAADRAVKAVGAFGLDGPIDRWKRLRREIFDEVCEKGYDADRETFTQYYGSRELDAALLVIPDVGFLPAGDPRVRGTAAAVERELMRDGFVDRYPTTPEQHDIDGLTGTEGAFLPCTFWLADNYVLQGDVATGRAIFERLLSLRNDVGLLAEEYDRDNGRLVGNYPQALSHIPLINTAFNLASTHGPAHRRGGATTDDSS
ncbi:glycoside hydrolase family 15 protein [Phytoactinopolyspora halotolerans]|uniref:Trehalase n=1 Tax=Phytoactinopolyspora halotolerans TaxID=1981512 RepID=A0A6L9SEQ0_9ACTN|nr:glycoside hydrolase family 15 protein [Phytoactinopolyspora halotolerans]NEE03549.1 glycoside hydrolase family 15 protein [Phytoactinopolyspora halotolerans]